MKKKLAIVTGYDMRNFAGSERYIIELAKRVKRYYNVKIFSMRNEKDVRVNDRELIKHLNGIKLEWYKAFTIPKSLDRVPLKLSGLKAYISLRKYDVVYFIDPSLTAIASALLVLKFSKTKFIFGLHIPIASRLRRRSGIKRIYDLIYRAVLFSVPNIHVLNSDDYNLIKDSGYKGNLYLIPNFLYIKPDKPKDNKKFIALFVGRLAIYHKGLDYLADIIKRVLKLNKDIEFHIAGSGEGKSIIEELTKAYPKNVIYKGFLLDKDLEKEYKNAAIFIVTSRMETFSLVTLEAQAHGLPVISFDIAGPNEIIKDGLTGKSIKPFDTDKFAKAILDYYDLWRKGRLNKELKEKIIKLTFDRYSDKKIIPQIIKMLSN
ncbi:MAG: glycosyltransferase Gtf1 [Candidatus Micrarchaeota archaeon]|nr:MAG: glycosyltransferase Gtf1 [Candidatus Micrarchaeota archaeon]